MRIGHVDLAQGTHERGEVDCRLIQIVDRAVSVLAGQPLVDRPWVGVALSRMTHRQLHRKRERQVRCQSWQPLRLLRRLVGCPPDARQPRGKVFTQLVDVVVSPVRRDGLDRQLGPLRELPGKQATHERDVGSDLVGMHPG